MRSEIHRDLRQAERRESHLWMLAFGLLILFGTVIVGHYAVLLLDDAGSESESALSRATTYRAVGGLFFLVALFCLYALRTLIRNRRMKNLLVEMSGVAASSMDLEDFLPSIARKIGMTSMVTTCQIALLEPGRTTLRIGSVHAASKVSWRPCCGEVRSLEQLSFWAPMERSVQPILLRRADLAPPAMGQSERGFLTGNLPDVHSVLVVPMVTKNGLQGVIILGQAKGAWARRFTASRIALAQTLARHAGGAIDQSKLKREATRDPLTNLFNRRQFSDRIREELTRAELERQTMVVLLCDLDRFKLVNDTRGHQIGDAALEAAARSIQQSTRGTDLVFRWGGDEIVVLLPNSSREGSLIVANRIRDGVLYAGRAADIDLDVSIGISLYPDHGRDEAELIRVADRALYIAKKKTGGKVQVGEEEYRLDRHSIAVVFQPVVDVSSNRILGYEALSRDPQGKLSAFELFEKYRAIGRLTELKQLAFELQIRTAHEIGLERVFVNADFDVLGQIEPRPRPAGLEVVVELSELEALHDLENHLRVARSWRDQGYEFAIDDFGAGFVSFPFLAMLVPDYIKVDRSAMLQAVASEKFKGFLGSLVRAVRTYAPSGIIAEGIEEQRELELVREMDISFVQGYLYGKPRPLDRPAVIAHPVGAQRSPTEPVLA